jgi:hypothetical protein
METYLVEYAKHMGENATPISRSILMEKAGQLAAKYSTKKFKNEIPTAG